MSSLAEQQSCWHKMLLLSSLLSCRCAGSLMPSMRPVLSFQAGTRIPCLVEQKSSGMEYCESSLLVARVAAKAASSWALGFGSCNCKA